MKIIKIKQGFTLIEVLTATALSILVIVGAYAIYQISYKSYKQNFVNAELAQNARIALERMTRDIRQANDILTALPANLSEGPPASEIKFQDGHSFWSSGKIQYISFYLDSNNLHRKVTHYTFTLPCSSADTANWVVHTATGDPGESITECQDEDVIKAEKISALQFWGRYVITISMAVTNGNNTYNFETKALGRNVQ